LILSFLLLAGLVQFEASSQTSGVGQIDDTAQRFLQRQYIIGNLSGAGLTALPMSGFATDAAFDTLRSAELSARDKHQLEVLQGLSTLSTSAALNRRFAYLYANGRDFVNYNGDGYSIAVNPLAYLRIGALSGLPEEDPRGDIYWRNTRGIDVAGKIGKYVFFETRLEENQRLDPRLKPEEDNKTATRLGKATVNSKGVLDYMVATGVVGFSSRFFEVQFGRDRARLGYGQGSIVLSNFGPVFDQLQIRTTLGRIQYVNIFASLATKRRFNRDSIVPKKYAAIHRLEVQATDRLQFSIFETVVFASDSLDGRKGFDIAYMNPLIFYRAVEADRGSPDNVLLGGGASYRPVDGVMIHAELLLDELRVSRIGDKWWANKWAGQIGVKTALLDGLLAGIEYTRIRPYMYSHNEPLNAYVHYQDFLGHPAGPNAVDWTLFVDYRVRPRIGVQVAAAYTIRGADDGELNYGSNPLLPNSTRTGDENISLLQGIREVELNVDAAVSYELLPELFLEAGFWTRRVDNAQSGAENLIAPLVGFRWGLPMETARW
ncbi:MAG: hypothetical protein HKN13_02240, partial [Rhodothermales bacterium]|nr:hypothetical protein [Rhodothermales bacterium]